MSFIEGNFAQPKEDLIARIRSLQGDLTEEECRVLMAEIFDAYPGFMYHILTGEELFPFQILKCKMFSDRDSVCDISGRGGAKSFTAAVWALICAILNPGIKILIAAPSLRQCISPNTWVSTT